LLPLLVIEAADKAHALEQFFRGIRGEIKQSIFLANLCGDHKIPIRSVLTRPQRAWKLKDSGLKLQAPIAGFFSK
jgi:hypothetical protein